MVQLILANQLPLFPIIQDYDIFPKLQCNIRCHIYLLGRDGLSDQAETLITSKEMKPDGFIQAYELGSCTPHNNIELGKYMAEHQKLGLMLLSNIYGGPDRWDEQKQSELG